LSFPATRKAIRFDLAFVLGRRFAGLKGSPLFQFSDTSRSSSSIGTTKSEPAQSGLILKDLRKGGLGVLTP
jgi:hypothetical protein